MKRPRKWTTEELENDVRQAISIFRNERLYEPMDRYKHYFENFVSIFDDLVSCLTNFPSENGIAKTRSVFDGDDDRRTAFRYLTAPPISEDDLKILADSALSARALKQDENLTHRIRDIILRILDPFRFPWVEEGREPTDLEREIAVFASAALVAVRKVETERRNQAGKKPQVEVASMLTRIGYEVVDRREISTLNNAPDIGQFCGECKLGDTRADIVVRLYDSSVMPIECKASNSAVNSYKRINHEAVGKARKWQEAFGDRQTVPAAVITGVFNPQNLEMAQRDGLSIFWGHRLDDLEQYIRSTME